MPIDVMYIPATPSANDPLAQRSYLGVSIRHKELFELSPDATADGIEDMVIASIVHAVRRAVASEVRHGR